METLPALERPLLADGGDAAPFSLRLLPPDPLALLARPPSLSSAPPSPPPPPHPPLVSSAAGTEDDHVDSGRPDALAETARPRTSRPTWAGWYDVHAGPSAEARRARRLTDRDADASLAACREGLIHTLEGCDGRPKGSKYVVPRPAPVHGLDEVLAALVGVATCGSSNTLFQWDSHRALYRWAGTLGQQERARGYLGTVQAMRAANAREPVPPFAEWQGPERIAGVSSPASQSLVRPFLEVGTMHRRLQEQGTSLLHADPPSKELRALVRAVDVVLAWAVRRLGRWNPVGGPLALSHEVEEIRTILLSLCRLLDCAPPRSPPFKLTFDPSEPAKVLNHVYAQYASSLPGGGPVVQRALLWVLEKVSYDWRSQVAAWVGWPGVEPHPSHQVGDEAVTTPSQQAADVPYRKTDPWAGARVEWTVDARGEEDVGYRLLPSKLPSFISVAKARCVLEAGRAVRLLRKAARADHPLVQLLEQKNKEGLPLPSWLSSDEQHAQRRAQAQVRIRELQHRVAVWRHSRSVARPCSANNCSGDETDCSSRATPPTLTRLGPEDPLALMALCDLPPLGDDSDEEDEDSKDLTRWLTTRTLPGDKPAQRLLEVPLLWSQLISGSLISVFFRDVGLPTYLDTCRHFLLLGSAPFADHMQDLLFSDGVDVHTILGEGLNPSIGRVWPPSPGTIAPRFNAAVLEAVAGWRSTVARQEAGPRQGQKRDVLLDLDERLSFAVVDPHLSKIRGRKRSRWQDPRSIDALDWLTLSFTPPPLIAPLLTAQAQMSYQRVLNLLLRIMRINAVLRGLYTKLFKLRPARGDVRTLFVARAQHFVTHLGAHVEQVAIKDMWDSFQSRLVQLQAHVEQQDAFMLVDDDGEDEGEESDENMASSFISRAPSTRESGSGGTLHELRDVFSLARYHERVLDRMVGCLFQKTAQANVGRMIDGLFQLILTFSQLVREDAADEGAMQAEALLHKFDVRFGTLVRALRIVERSGRGRRSAHTRELAPEGLDPETRAELQRQMDEADQDLRLLEVEARTLSHGEAEWASFLVTRLDPTVRYAV